MKYFEKERIQVSTGITWLCVFILHGLTLENNVKGRKNK